MRVDTRPRWIKYSLIQFRRPPINVSLQVIVKRSYLSKHDVPFSPFSPDFIAIFRFWCNYRGHGKAAADFLVHFQVRLKSLCVFFCCWFSTCFLFHGPFLKSWNPFRLAPADALELEHSWLRWSLLVRETHCRFLLFMRRSLLFLVVCDTTVLLLRLPLIWCPGLPLSG